MIKKKFKINREKNRLGRIFNSNLNMGAYVLIISILFIFLAILSSTIISAQSGYARSFSAYTNQPTISFSQGQSFQLFNREMCQAGQDFILQVNPLGCVPSVVRSDLLEEQNVPVFCPIVATQLNPLIDVQAIDNVIITGQTPREVSGIGYQPARAALGNLGARGIEIDSPAFLDNIGYAVIVLGRQPNESAMPDFVEGNLTARLRYDVKNAFGVGKASFYLPVLTDQEWEERNVQYGFWQGRGYLRAESLTEGGATISIYSDREATGTGLSGEKRRISSNNLNVGETSPEIPMPGFNFCFGTMHLRLDGLENPDTTVRLEVNGNEIELQQGEKLIEDKCQVRNIDKKGVTEKVTINCREDQGSSTFDLVVSPRVNISVNGEIMEKGIGDRIYQQDAEKSVYLVYVTTKGNTGNEKNLSIGLASVRGNQERLTQEQVNSLAGFFNRAPNGDIDGLFSLIGQGLRYSVSILERSFRWAAPSETFRNVNFGESRDIFGKSISLMGFGEARDIDISGVNRDLRNYYEDIREDYGDIKESFSQEKYPAEDPETLGQKALDHEIIFLWATDQKRSAKELCGDFEESYPDAIPPAICTDTRKLASPSSAVHDVNILGRTYRIIFDEIVEPTFKDFGATIFVNGEGINKPYDLRKQETVLLDEKSGAFIQLLDVDEDSSGQKSVRIRTNLREGAVEAVGGVLVGESTTIVLREGFPDSRKGYTFSLQNVNLKKVARVTVNPKINFAETEATFNFKIGIEKRGISLTPEQTQEKIKSLNETLEKLGNINSRLGDVVSKGKAACFGIGVGLTVKNFLANLGGEGIARQKVMRSNGGWFDICEDAANRGEYGGSVESCLLENNRQIEDAVDAYRLEIERQNSQFDNLQRGITEKSFLGEDVVNTDKLLERYVEEGYKSEVKNNLQSAGISNINVGNEQVSVTRIVDSMNADNVPLTQARSIQLNSRLANSQDSRVKEIAVSQITADLSDFWVNSRVETERQGFAGAFGDAAALFSSNEKLQEIPITEAKLWSQVKGEFTSGGSEIGNNNLTYKLKDIATAKEYLLVLDNDYVIRDTYQISNRALTKISKAGDPNYLNLKPVYYDENTYRHEYQNPEIRYYEQEPYKGLPAIVPFDVDNGWYAAIKSSLPIGGNIRAFDDSGRVSSFWLCNVGLNGREEFNSPGADVCQQINLGTGQPYNQFPGLSPNEASSKVSQAIEAIRFASQRYSVGLSSLNIQGNEIEVGRPAVSTPEIQCQDFMSASECNLLFNVCDPVICPSSRCDFGGNYPVEDVVQSGVIGGLLLCAPNFPEVKVPVCLSAVHAGVDGYLSVIDSYQQCLQTSLETGQTVGVCDELHSVYMCEFLWRQGLPLAQAVIPPVVGKIAGQATRGGGEYLGVQDAFEKAETSAEFFTQSYAVNSFEAFRARSLSNAGTEVCRNWISYTVPGGNLFDALTAPDSPSQFYGRFDEIPFTTATNPPTSHYKTFYHVYAGKDFPAYFQVYLRGTGSSFFQDTRFPRIVAQGFIPAGEFKTETIDFTAPSGYQEMCIVVNGREECGFKQVTTDFGINYMTEQYIASQANDVNVRKESECVSGTRSIVPLLSPNIQAGVEEGLVNPAIYNRGIVRVCATENPGLGSDANVGTEDSRWRKVGICGNENIGCWLDSNSVRNAIKDTDIENSVLQDSEQAYIEALNNEAGAADFETVRKEIEQEESLTGKINLINENINRVFLNYQKGYLTLLRADATVGLALEIYEPIKAARQAAEDAGEIAPGTTTAGEYPVLEFEDGRPDVNIFYTYSGTGWFWTLTPNTRNSWISVSDELDEDFVEDSSDVAFIISLRGRNYVQGVQLLTLRTTGNTKISTENVEYFSDKTLAVKKPNPTQQEIEFGDIKVYFRFNTQTGFWEWSENRNTWTSVHENIPPKFNQRGNKVADAIDSATVALNLFQGAAAIFSIDAKPFTGVGTGGQQTPMVPVGARCEDCGGFFNPCSESECRELSRQSGVVCSFEVRFGLIPNVCREEENLLRCSSDSNCQEVIGQEAIKIAQQVKQQRGVTDSSVQQDTGVKTFECLVLMVSRVESGIRQCRQSQQNGNPLYCEGDWDSLISGDIASNGIMQINTAFRNAAGQNIGHCGTKGLSSNLETCREQLSDFETNVRTGANLLIDGHISGSKVYNCYRPPELGDVIRETDFQSKTYSGWEAALRNYNGWNTLCYRRNETTGVLSKVGNPNYVEDVLSTQNRQAVAELFPEVCG